MKKSVILAFFLGLVTLTVSAQGFYFDLGIGVGKAWTKVDGDDIVDDLKSSGLGVDESTADFGLKAGYGPFSAIPLYFVGEFGAVGHKIDTGSNFILFNSFIAGLGIVVYPIKFIQIGSSFGYSYVANKTDMPSYTVYDSKSGFAWNVSTAVDLGKGSQGCLIGIKYFYANNTLNTLDVVENASMICVFVKYAYRNK